MKHLTNPGILHILNHRIDKGYERKSNVLLRRVEPRIISSLGEEIIRFFAEGDSIWE